MTGRIYEWARRGAVFGMVSFAALTAAGAGAVAEEMVTVTMTKSQYDALMNVLPRIEQLEAQVRDNGQNLKRQQDEQQLTNEKIEAVAETTAERQPVESKKDGVTLEISGQVNMGVLYADSGESDGSDENRKVWIVDNDNSSSRFRFIAKAPVDENLTLGAVIELEVERNASDEVTQDDIAALGFDFNLRKVEAVVNHKKYGKFRTGQGDTASNGITEQDLSGTGLISKSEVNAVGGSLIFRAPGGAFNGGCGGNCDIDNYFNNQDGLSRKMRVRYDTPAWHGMSLSSSYINGGAYDVRAQHSYQWPAAGGLKVAAAVGWYDGTAIGGDEGVGGSASVLHVPTGLSLTGATGQILDAGGDPEPNFWYLKGGWRGDVFDFGSTAVSADYWSGKDYEVLGSNSDSIGFQVVQRIAKTSTQLYIGGRVFMVDNTGFGNFQDVYTVMSGLRQLF